MAINKTQKVQIRMTEELANRYRTKADKLGITFSAMLTIGLNEYLRQEDLTQTVVDMVQNQKTKKEIENNA